MKSDPKAIYVSRPVSPAKVEVTPEVRMKHDRSVKLYPEIHLTDGEYVLFAIKRHPIGMIPAVLLGLLLTATGLSVMLNTDFIFETFLSSVANFDHSLMTVPALLFSVLAALGTYVVYYVYTNNRLYLTNESVIQIIQTSLFSRQEQIASLGSVEDSSFKQDSFLQHMFNYGNVRLSTVGDETTYTFDYAPRPKYHVELLNATVESYKNGRGVDIDRMRDS